MKKKNEIKLIRVELTDYIKVIDIIKMTGSDRKTINKYLEGFAIKYVIVGKTKIYNYDQCKNVIKYLKERKEANK